MIEQVATSASRSLLLQLPERHSDGTVHSVYDHAVNVTWDDDGWSSLLLPPLPPNPWSIQVPGLPDVRQGERCRISRREIDFGARAFRIRLDRAEPKDLRVHTAAAHGRRLREQCRRLRDWAIECEVRSGFLHCLCDPAQRTSRWEREDPLLVRGAEVIDAARRAETPRGRARHLQSLVGLGLGLTPAGDDFIVGYLAASPLSDRARADRRLLVEALPSLARTRTTDVSARMLEAACRNEFAEPVVELVESLARTRNGLFRAAEDLLALGGTSGADTLAGVLFAASSCHPTRQTRPRSRTGRTGPTGRRSEL